jgi:hypothetical protein
MGINKIIKIIIWILLIIIFSNVGFNMISAPNTIENIIGIVIILAIIIITVETNFLTTLTIKKSKNHEKDI